MAIDVAGLTAPLSEEAPSGPDLSYETERQEIEAFFERSVSGGGDEGAEIDWRAAIRQITAQAEKTRDLWLPVYLMRAAAQSGQFELLVDGAELLAGLMEERWADVHPQLDELGFIGRKTPCESLANFADFLRPLGRVPLIEHPRLGRYSGDDFARFDDQGSGAEGFGMFRALIDATSEDDMRQVVERIDALRQAIRRTDAVLTANAENDTATNFQPTYDAIDRIYRAVAAHVAGETVADEVSGGGSGSSQGLAPKAVHGGGGQAFSGGVSSREDVIKALNAICDYYARNEPNSPVPFALRRAKEWISLDFMAVLEDIAPGSIDEAARVLKSGRTSSFDSGTPGGESPSGEPDGGWGSSSGGDNW